MRFRSIMFLILVVMAFGAGWWVHAMVQLLAPRPVRDPEVTYLVDEEHGLLWFFCQGLTEQATYKLDIHVNYSLEGNEVFGPEALSVDVAIFFYAYDNELVVMYDYGCMHILHDARITGLAATLSRFS